MFDLVADVESYPEFVPLCTALRVHSRRQKRGADILTADMSVGYKAIQETFTSRVVVKPDDLAIDVSYIDGPFRFLDNRWSFVAIDAESCTVKFYIDYEFKSRALGMLMGSMFDRAFARFTKAFEARADVVYGVNQDI